MEDRLDYVLNNMVWDRARLRDLRLDIVGKKPVSEEFAIKVIRKIAPAIQKANALKLAPYLQQKIAISTKDFQQLTNPCSTSEQQAEHLLTLLFSLSTMPTVSLTLVGDLYLALNNSFEADIGLTAHHHLAVKKIRPAALATRGIDEKSEKMEKDPATVVEKLIRKSILINIEDAIVLRQNLGLPSEIATETAAIDVGLVFQEWIQSHSATVSMENLVTAVLHCPKQGRLVSDMLPLYLCNTPKVVLFVQNLRRKWKLFASYLGYTQKEIDTIEDSCSPGNIADQIQMFLRLWSMPDCGPNTEKILHEVKELAGIRETPADIGQAIQRSDTSAAGYDIHFTLQQFFQVLNPQGSEGASIQLHASPPGMLGVRQISDKRIGSAPSITTQTQMQNPSDSGPLCSTENTSLLQPSQGAPEALKDECHLPPLPESSVVDDDQTVLVACKKKEWETVQALVTTGGIVEARSQDGLTPLMYACKAGKTELVMMMISHGADITAVDTHGNCCLHFPETLKNQLLLEVLVNTYTDQRISVDLPSVKNGHTPLMVACIIGDSVLPSVEFLLKHEAKPDGDESAYCRPLVEASSRGHKQVVILLLEYHANPDVQDKSGCTALLQACKCNRSNIVSLLLEHEVRVNRSDHEGTTPLFSAIAGNSYAIAKQLIEKGANVNTTRDRTNPVNAGSVEETPLAHACARGFLEIGELLIQHEADVNYLCSGTVPPIGFAIICNQRQMVKFMLNNDKLDKTLKGLSVPIIIAVSVSNWHCARRLLSNFGGAEEALKMAEESQMQQLVDNIEVYMGMREELPSPPEDSEEEIVDPFQDRLRDPKFWETNETMQNFCQICVDSVINSVENYDSTIKSKEDLAAIADAAGQPFLRSYINNLQRPETLRQDLLSGTPSALKFMIDNKLLTQDNFHVQALKVYGEDTPRFCNDLVYAFHQFHGGQELPDDAQSVLKRLFSGQFQIGCETAILGGGLHVPSMHQSSLEGEAYAYMPKQSGSFNPYAATINASSFGGTSQPRNSHSTRASREARSPTVKRGERRFSETRLHSAEHTPDPSQGQVKDSAESSGPQVRVPNPSTHDAVANCKGSTPQEMSAEGILQDGAEQTATTEHQQEHITSSATSSHKYRQQTLNQPNPVDVTRDSFDRNVSRESGCDSQSFGDPTGDSISERPHQDTRELTDCSSLSQQRVLQISNSGQQDPLQQLSRQVSTTMQQEFRELHKTQQEQFNKMNVIQQEQFKQLHQSQQEQKQAQDEIQQKLQQLQKAVLKLKGSRIPIAERYSRETKLHPPTYRKQDSRLQRQFQSKLKKNRKKPSKIVKPQKSSQISRCSRNLDRSLLENVVQQLGKVLDLATQHY